MTTRTIRDRIGWAVVSVGRRLGLRPDRGVRAVVLDDAGRVLLVLPRYSEQWMLPGGGARRTETAEVAVRREVHEESGAIVDTPLTLLGDYTHTLFGRAETVSVFIGRCREKRRRPWSFEIRAASFFSFANLPTNIYPSTARRLSEYQSGKRDLRVKW